MLYALLDPLLLNARPQQRIFLLKIEDALHGTVTTLVLALKTISTK